MGPLVDRDAVDGMMRALERARQQGGEVLVGGNVLDRRGFHVEPTVVRGPRELPVAGGHSPGSGPGHRCEVGEFRSPSDRRPERSPPGISGRAAADRSREGPA